MVDADELMDLARAAVLVRRDPETVRRWVRSGRLAAQRHGRRWLVARSDVERIAAPGEMVGSLREWADRAAEQRAGASTASLGRSAADLILEDRRDRSGIGQPRARR